MTARTDGRGMKTSIALTPACLKKVPFLFPGKLAHGVDRAADLGYDAVELHIRDTAAEDMAAIRKLVDRRDVAVSSLGTGLAAVVDGLTLSSLDAACRREAFRRVCGHMNVAADFGACVILGSMQGRLSAAARERKAQIGYAVDMLSRLCEEAARRDVRVVLEALNRYETNFHNTVGDVLDTLKRVGSPHLGILADTFHLSIEERSLPGAIAQAGRRLWLVHFADSNRAAAGLGHTDFGPVMEALAGIGYEGYLSAEVLSFGDDERAARMSIRTMRRLLAGKMNKPRRARAAAAAES